jgi:hypothetical protein
MLQNIVYLHLNAKNCKAEFAKVRHKAEKRKFSEKKIKNFLQYRTILLIL